MKKPSICVAIPSNRDHKSAFSMCLLALQSKLQDDCNHGIFESYFINEKTGSSCLSVARQTILDEMRANKFTYWLSLDNDMTFPPNIVDHLMYRKKDVVACNYRTKNPIEQGTCRDVDGKAIDSTGRTGLQPIEAMGLGCALMRLDAFAHLKAPHFQVPWDAEHNKYIGEDIYFSMYLRAHDIELFCDHDASQLVGHVGDYTYQWSKAVAKQQAA